MGSRGPALPLLPPQGWWYWTRTVWAEVLSGDLTRRRTWDLNMTVCQCYSSQGDTWHQGCPGLQGLPQAGPHQGGDRQRQEATHQHQQSTREHLTTRDLPCSTVLCLYTSLKNACFKMVHLVQVFKPVTNMNCVWTNMSDIVIKILVEKLIWLFLYVGRITGTDLVTPLHSPFQDRWELKIDPFRWMFSYWWSPWYLQQRS